MFYGDSLYILTVYALLKDIPSFALLPLSYRKISAYRGQE